MTPPEAPSQPDAKPQGAVQDLGRLRIDRGPAPTGGRPRGRRRSRGWVVWLLLLGAGYAFRRPLLTQLDAWTLPRVALAEAYLPEPGAVTGARGVASNGYVIARRQAALSAEEPGRIVELFVEEGSRVRAGEVETVRSSDLAATLLFAAEVREWRAGVRLLWLHFLGLQKMKKYVT